jgi:hypothetical protein
MPEASDDAVIASFERAGRIMFDPLKLDAFRALCAKGASACGDASDDLTRELYGFLCGALNVLAAMGDRVAGALLDVMQAPGVRGDLPKMRAAITTALGAMTAN